MKKILIDPGDFYTKTHVYEVTGRGPESYGQYFFPSISARTQSNESQALRYEQEGSFYSVGYDCHEAGFDSLHGKAGDFGSDCLNGLLILKKIIFDYSANNEEIELGILIETPYKQKIWGEIVEHLNQSVLTVSAIRGFDQARIQKTVKLQTALLTAGDSLLNFLRTINSEFESALVVDIGYHTTKIYIANSIEGIASFQLLDIGIWNYYKIVFGRLLENKIKPDYFWVIKQIEAGLSQLEFESGDLVDISQITDQTRWDLNKNLTGFISDFLVSYFTNVTQWVEMMVVTGGGASFMGELLVESLREGGLDMEDIYIEKFSLYARVNHLISN
ncbi:MAG: hypothetical protein HQM15_07360 [Deltaproteobacteria bacterium]|nr:hypothetical protein [Deltaproteobacteria bacterium]